MPQKEHLLLREGNYPAPQPQVVLGRLYLGSREVRGQGGRITMDKIEDGVTPWVHAGNQIGPGDLAFRPDARLQREETTPAGGGGKGGHAPPARETVKQFWGHAVD